MKDLSKIKHVVVLTMENRSFDHVFGGYRGEHKVDIANPDVETNQGRDGHLYEISQLNDQLAGVFEPDPNHGWQAVEQQINGGKMDGFVRNWVDNFGVKAMPRDAVMGYLVRKHQPVTYFFADEYMLLERYFASIATGTLPNRFYGLAGDSAGHRDNAMRKQLLLELRPIFSDLPRDAWRVYAGALPTLAMLGGIGEKRANLKNISRLSRFFTDAKNGALPKLTWIEPIYDWSAAFLARLVGIPDGAPNDDHPPSHTARGQQLFYDVYRALIADTDRWAQTLFIIYYDEHGGLYDHVAPPRIPAADVRSDGLTWMGPRVPGLLISPYAQRGGRSQVQFDHCSVLRFIADWFGVKPPGRAGSMHTSSIAAALLDDPRLGPPPQPPAPPTQPKDPPPDLLPPADEVEQAAIAYVDHLEADDPETFELLKEGLRQ